MNSIEAVRCIFVHNRVNDLSAIVDTLKRLCPDAEIAFAHGQMDSDHLEKVLVDFIDRKFDVLACTNIIETGLDIPNANTIIINRADMFWPFRPAPVAGEGRAQQSKSVLLFARAAHECAHAGSA